MALTAFNLPDKVALVAGASRGLGRVIAITLAEAGADLILVSRSQGDLDAVAGEVRDRGRRTLALAADVCVAADVNASVDAAAKEFGRVDVLVNNAGICPFFCNAEDLGDDGFDKIISVNLRGAFLCARAVGKLMISNKSGAIVNIASLCGVRGTPGLLAYSASKAGMISMTEVLATEWAQHNIRVNAVAPWRIGTGMGREQPSETSAAFRHSLPFGRPADREEVANAVLFLASDAASYVTGQTLVIDGNVAGFRPVTSGTEEILSP